MARAVEGFLSSDGKFWKTKEEADFHEAAYDLAMITISFSSRLFLSEFDADLLDEKLRDFIKANETVITDYYKANSAYDSAASKRSALSLAGQPTPDNPEDGESVRDGTDSSMGEDTTPEDNSSST